MKKTIGHVIYTPLSYIFNVLEIGGSAVQQYDKISQEYEPDRSLIPYVLQPKLIVKDDDGVLGGGDMTSYLVNGIWTVKVVDAEGNTTTLQTGDSTYNVDKVNGYKLTLYRNCGLTETMQLSFSADFSDSRRGDTQKFSWEKELTSQTQATYNFQLKLSTPKKTTLSPLRNRGEFDITALVTNGSDDVTEMATIKWYVYENGQYFDLAEIDDETEGIDYYPLWFNYASEDKLNVIQSRVQDAIVKCVATIKGQELSEVFRMIRRYGQYEESLDILEGAFIKTGQTRAHVQVSVANRKGVIDAPERYFDIEIFHSEDGEDWEGVSNSSEYVMEDGQLSEHDHQFGTRVRELTAEIPLTMPDGSPLTDQDGNIIVVQVPETE